MIIGVWRAIGMAMDTNGNHSIDANEWLYPAANQNVMYTFKKNGDLEAREGAQVYNLRWDLRDGGKILTTIIDGEETNGKVLLLNNTDLKLEYQVDRFLTQSEFKKQ
jgi:hypothetical protein